MLRSLVRLQVAPPKFGHIATTSRKVRGICPNTGLPTENWVAGVLNFVGIPLGSTRVDVPPATKTQERDNHAISSLGDGGSGSLSGCPSCIRLFRSTSACCDRSLRWSSHR